MRLSKIDFRFLFYTPKNRQSKKNNAIFYVATFTGPIPKFFDRNPAPAISGILANYAFRLYITSVAYSMWLSLVKSCTLWNINIYILILNRILLLA